MGKAPPEAMLLGLRDHCDSFFCQHCCSFTFIHIQGTLQERFEHTLGALALYQCKIFFQKHILDGGGVLFLFLFLSSH